MCLATLQEGIKAYYMVKHNKNDFAKGRNYINEIMIFCVLANSKQKFAKV